jgi:hypothetical protein
MNKIYQGFGIFTLLVVIASGLFLFAMRFSDGPLEIISGGPFKTGELSPAPSDWSFLKERDTIEFQTLDPLSSRTVWVASHEGRMFIVSGYMNQGSAAIWKQWPHYLEDDNRIILRIDGKLYEQKLIRIMDDPAVVPVLNELSRKYLGGEAVTSNEQVIHGDTWMFEVADR